MPHPSDRFRTLAWWLAVAAWMTLIFVLSAQHGTESAGLSDTTGAIAGICLTLIAHAVRQRRRFQLRHPR